MTTNQLGLFDLGRARELRDEGMSRAAEHDRYLLERARQIAVELAMSCPERTCDSDLVQQKLIDETGRWLGNAAGSLFKGKGWEFTGRWKASRRVSNHSRVVRVWRLANPGK